MCYFCVLSKFTKSNPLFILIFSITANFLTERITHLDFDGSKVLKMLPSLTWFTSVDINDLSVILLIHGKITITVSCCTSAAR